MLFWIKRTFDFDLPPEMYHMVLERLRGTPARLEEMVRDLPSDILTRRLDDSWSISEIVGHLGDVERLWAQRMDDFMAGQKELHAADMSNRRTESANHNDTAIDRLLLRFRDKREKLVVRLDNVEDKDIERSALHPRLNKQMRIIDSAFFGAEHDDHHLVRITRIIRRLK